MEPGALRELHWHPNASEWQYVLYGQFNVILFGSKGRADLVPEMRPSMYPPAVSAPTSGWYLRGFIGASNESLSRISHPDFLTAPQFVFLDKGGFDGAPFGGGGIGFQWNNWLRTDATVEYRGKTQFHALDRFRLTPAHRPISHGRCMLVPPIRSHPILQSNCPIDIYV
jgi:hypothetical protein